MVLDKDLFDTGVGAEFQTGLELVGVHYLNVKLITLTKATDLVKFVLVAVDQYKILRFSLDEQLLEGVSVHASLEGQIARAALDLHISFFTLVGEHLRVLRLQVLEPIVGLHVGLLLYHIRDSLIHLHSFVLIEHQLLLFLLLIRDK